MEIIVLQLAIICPTLTLRFSRKFIYLARLYLWQKGLYIELHAYQHHVFMDWQFVDDEKWQAIYSALNCVGVETMQSKWDEMFGEKEEVLVVEMKVKKRRRRKR